ncbi:hypothetical protein R3P38DRAFT_3376237 [Favolaschia claudopus]|uniref:Uncharacterized protein n=1 Tax=Favolaschia claudopus TaxID=2862362 RepID=A0AAV9ZG19_9AGAR
MTSTDQCAVGPDGQLLDASKIVFYNDPDDANPLPPVYSQELAPLDYHWFGDAVSLIPLGPPDSLNLRTHATVHVCGAPSNIDKENSTFDIKAEQYLSAPKQRFPGSLCIPRNAEILRRLRATLEYYSSRGLKSLAPQAIHNGLPTPPATHQSAAAAGARPEGTGNRNTPIQSKCESRTAANDSKSRQSLCIVSSLGMMPRLWIVNNSTPVRPRFTGFFGEQTSPRDAKRRKLDVSNGLEDRGEGTSTGRRAGGSTNRH